MDFFENFWISKNFGPEKKFFLAQKLRHKGFEACWMIRIKKNPKDPEKQSIFERLQKGAQEGPNGGQEPSKCTVSIYKMF